jgi:hypothetical protein
LRVMAQRKPFGPTRSGRGYGRSPRRRSARRRRHGRALRFRRSRPHANHQSPSHHLQAC